MADQKKDHPSRKTLKGRLETIGESEGMKIFDKELGKSNTVTLLGGLFTAVGGMFYSIVVPVMGGITHTGETINAEDINFVSPSYAQETVQEGQYFAAQNIDGLRNDVMVVRGDEGYRLYTAVQGSDGETVYMMVEDRSEAHDMARLAAYAFHQKALSTDDMSVIPPETTPEAIGFSGMTYSFNNHSGVFGVPVSEGQSSVYTLRMAEGEHVINAADTPDLTDYYARHAGYWRDAAVGIADGDFDIMPEQYTQGPSVTEAEWDVHGGWMAKQAGIGVGILLLGAGLFSGPAAFRARRRLKKMKGPQRR